MSAEATTSEGEVSRREFMFYTWLASVALATAGMGGAALLYAYPRVKEGKFGGRFVMGPVAALANGSVTHNREGKFFLVRLGDEFRALYQVCTHLGCLVRQTEQGFACPCHGSRFAKDGTLVASPAPRDMDRLAVEIVDGTVVVDTGKRTKGQARQV